MSFKLGNTNISELYLGSNKIAQAYLGSNLVYQTSAPGPVDPYNPLGLPANTVRVRTSNGNAPIKGTYTSYETATLVAGTTDVYDVYKSGTDFTGLLRESTNVVEVLGANTTGITDVSRMFMNCSSLTTIPLFDTSSVTLMNYLCNYCSSLKNIPLFDTSKVTRMNDSFSYCSNVEGGALALYQQAISQTKPVSYHQRTFKNCGSNTQSGAAELEQIPSSWK